MGEKAKEIKLGSHVMGFSRSGIHFLSGIIERLNPKSPGWAYLTLDTPLKDFKENSIGRYSIEGGVALFDEDVFAEISADLKKTQELEEEARKLRNSFEKKFETVKI